MGLIPTHLLVVSGLSPEIESDVSKLDEASRSKSVPFEEMECLMSRILEKASKKQTLAAVEGRWELIFSTSFGSGYLPVAEIFTTLPSEGIARIDTTWGPLPLGSILGASDWDEKTSTVTFTFNEIKLGPISIPKQQDPKTYNFFWMNDELALAKSSAGGITLLKKVK